MNVHPNRARPMKSQKWLINCMIGRWYKLWLAIFKKNVPYFANEYELDKNCLKMLCQIYFWQTSNYPSQRKESKQQQGFYFVYCSLIHIRMGFISFCLSRMATFLKLTSKLIHLQTSNTISLCKSWKILPIIFLQDLPSLPSDRSNHYADIEPCPWF